MEPAAGRAPALPERRARLLRAEPVGRRETRAARLAELSLRTRDGPGDRQGRCRDPTAGSCSSRIRRSTTRIEPCSRGCSRRAACSTSNRSCAATASRALDALLGRDEFDIVGEFGVEIPLRTIGFLFGIPEADQDAYRKTTDQLITTDGTPVAFDQSSFDAVLSVLADYVDWRARNPSDDLMTELLNAEVDEPDGSRRPLTRDEVVTYASMVAGAGNETATRLIGFTMQLLAQHPDQRRLLVEDPSLIPAAIEEILRMESPSPAQARYVQHDVEVHGTIVPEGSTMLLLNGAANRDERHWTNPDRLDVRRDEGAASFVRLWAPLLSRRGLGAVGRVRRARGDPAPVARVGCRHRSRADGPHRQRARLGLPPVRLAFSRLITDR